MSRFAVDHLTPVAARRRLDEVDLEEKSRLAEGLALIALMDARRDFLEAGYSSMQRYCMERLSMSEEQAQRRIRAARLGREFPAVFERIADGRLTVTNACELAPALTAENAGALLDAAARQSKLEVRRLVAQLGGERSASAGAEGPEHPSESGDAATPSLPGLGDFASPDTSMKVPAPARVNSQVRGRVFETPDGGHELRVALTDEEFAAFTQARDLLSHVVRNGDPAVVVARSLAFYSSHLHRRRFGARAGAGKAAHTPRGRHIPAALRHEVAARDGHCCSFVGTDGHRCGDTRGLQFDHVTPLALGGETSAANLRLLCANHNRHEAERRLGSEYVSAKRESAERDRAQERQAKQREQQRASERASNAAPPASATADADDRPGAPANADVGPSDTQRLFDRRESDLDTIAALRALGCSHERARLAAHRTAALADGPIEARVHAAIKSLGRGVASRHARPAGASETYTPAAG